MKKITLENGVVARLPENLRERREMAAGIQLQDANWQISKQQRCGNDVSLPLIVMSLVCGSDDLTQAVTIKQMIVCAAKENICLTPRQLYRIIRHMKRPIVSVRRINRHHGHTIKDMVIDFGGIREVTFQPAGPNELGEIGYYFGKSNAEVNHLRNTTYRDRLSQLWL